MPPPFELKIASKGDNIFTTLARAIVPHKRQASLTNQGFKIFASRKNKFGKTTDRHFDANEAEICFNVVTVRRFSRSESIAHVTIQPLDGKELLILATKNVEDAREFVNELAAIKKLPTNPETSTPEPTPPASPEVTPASFVELEALPSLSAPSMGVIIEPAATALLPENSMLLAAPTTGMKLILAAAGAMPLPTELFDLLDIPTITEAAPASPKVADLIEPAATVLPRLIDLVDAPVITTITEAASASLTVADLSTTTTTLVLHSTSASKTTTTTTVPPPVLDGGDHRACCHGLAA